METFVKQSIGRSTWVTVVTYALTPNRCQKDPQSLLQTSLIIVLRVFNSNANAAMTMDMYRNKV